MTRWAAPRGFWEASSAEELVDEIIFGAWFWPSSLAELRRNMAAMRCVDVAAELELGAYLGHGDRDPSDGPELRAVLHRVDVAHRGW